jgi:hypothetical protein
MIWVVVGEVAVAIALIAVSAGVMIALVARMEVTSNPKLPPVQSANH